MQKIETGNIVFNDGDDMRAISCSGFNWVLDKESGVACCWGDSPEETPPYDPCAPQELVWEIKDFVLGDFLRRFNFLANVRKKAGGGVEPVPAGEDTLRHKGEYVCLSTFSNMVFAVPADFRISPEFMEFFDYVKGFGVGPKLQIAAEGKIDAVKFKGFPVILDVGEKMSSAAVLAALKDLKAACPGVNFKLHVDKEHAGRALEIIKGLDPDTAGVIFFKPPWCSTMKYLEIQSACLGRGLQNIAVSQCGKHRYSSEVVGSIVIELPCSYCRYSLFISGDTVMDCEVSRRPIGKIEDFKDFREIWDGPAVTAVRENLVDRNECKLLEL